MASGRGVARINNKAFELLNRQRFVQGLIEERHRSGVATAKAIHGDERELTVIGGFADADSKSLARAVEELGA
jgi:hypothetical protein